MRVVIESILGVSAVVTAPDGFDAEACACRAVEVTGFPCRVKEIGDGQGE